MSVTLDSGGSAYRSPLARRAALLIGEGNQGLTSAISEAAPAKVQDIQLVASKIITIGGFRGIVLMAKKRLATPWIPHHPADPGLSEPFKSSRDNVAAGASEKMRRPEISNHSESLDQSSVVTPVVYQYGETTQPPQYYYGSNATLDTDVPTTIPKILGLEPEKNERRHPVVDHKVDGTLPVIGAVFRIDLLYETQIEVTWAREYKKPSSSAHLRKPMPLPWVGLEGGRSMVTKDFEKDAIGECLGYRMWFFCTMH
ncbi:hypothetical protein H4582DRAFT_2059048 [Lactarius indigo]|nr:hypothetical protein H4582DRAFT_2059048 [Lactarius indigo]